MVKVSIVMPLYNQEKYIAECLASVAGQTLQDIEIIVVNDGSTDRSMEIVRDFAARDGRIVVVDKENGGYGAAMNAGMDRATGEYIGIVETDDYILPEMFEILYNAAIEHGDADLVKSDFFRFSSEEGFISRTLVKLSSDAHYYNRVLRPLDEKKVFSFPMNTWTGIYRREFLEKFHIRHNETPGAAYQDNGFWFQTFCFAQKVLFIDKAFYMNRRDNPNSSVYDSGKVYCACREYEHIDTLLQAYPEIRKEASGCFWLKKYHNYVFTLQRIAYQFRREFATHMREEFFTEVGGPDTSLMSDKECQDLAELARGADLFLHRLGLIADGSPFFSVIILKTNGDFIKTFTAVANQTYGNIQILAAGNSFTDKERKFLNGDGRVEVIERAGMSHAELFSETFSLVRGKYLHLLPSGAVSSSKLYAEVSRTVASGQADVIVCRAMSELEDGFVVNDLQNFRYKKDGKMSVRENPYMLYQYGISSVNKIFYVPLLRQNKLAVQSFGEDGCCPAFVGRAMVLSDRVAVEQRESVRRHCAIDAMGRMTCIEECLALGKELQGNERIGLVNLIASELYNACEKLCLDMDWIAEHREEILSVVSPVKVSRESYYYGYLYDFLIKLLYLGKAEPLFERGTTAPLLLEGAASTNGSPRLSAGSPSRNSNGDYAAEIESILNSVSFRVGRMVTYLPRKARGAFRRFRAAIRSLISFRQEKKGGIRAKKGNPLVSIILPMYNVEKYIRACLDSLIDQTYTNIEIICVDDGSNDGTCSIVEEYISRYPNILLLRQEHCYAGVARNRGFAEAKGKYCLFLDSDDFFEREFVESMVVRAEGCDADITVCRCRGYNQQTGETFPMPWSVHENRIPMKSVFGTKGMEDYICTAFMGWAWDKLYRSSFLRKLNLQFQGLRSSNDAYFVFTSLALAKRITFINRVFVNQRRFTQSSISQTREKSWNNCLAAADKIYEDWNERGIYKKYERAFCNWYVNFIVWHYTTLGNEARVSLAERLPEYAKKYTLFGHPADFYYLKKDYERFVHLCEGQA